MAFPRLVPAIALAAMAGPALADAARTQALAPFLAALMMPAQGRYAYADWNGVRTMPGMSWAKDVTLLDKPTPEGAMTALNGGGTVAGRRIAVVATGARTMVGAFLVIDQTPFTTPEDIAQGLRGGRFTLTPARCGRNGGYPDQRRWYRVGYPGRQPAYLTVAPVQGGYVGYRLSLDQLPPMSEREAAILTDSCGTGAGAAPAARITTPANGTEAAIRMIDALMRPAADLPAIPWASLPKLAPYVKWNAAPLKMTMPYAAGGEDLNNLWLSAQLKTPTTDVEVSASGTAAGATRFYLQNIRNTQPAAVFAGLVARGYRIEAARCGKPYTGMSENWFAITAPGKRPATLYRVLSRNTGELAAGYILRTDNALSKMEPGQRPAPPGGCPG